MWDWLYEWMKNISFYMVLISAIFTILPGEEYKKYIQFFSGFVLIILLITPFLRLFGIDEDLMKVYQNKEYKQQVEEMKMMDRYFENVDILDFLPDENAKDEEISTEKSRIIVEPIEITQ